MKSVFSALLVVIYSGLLYGQRQQVVVPTRNMPNNDTVWVFLPKTYKDEQKNYPVVYLLHGWSGNYKHWDNIIGAQSYADEYGFILVCPDGFYDSWYINSPQRPSSQYETFFFEDLMPIIENRYRADKKRVFITGLSMGGHGALYLFLRRPDLFRSAGSTSGVFDLRTLADRNLGLTKVLNKLDSTTTKRWLDYSVIGNIYKLKGSDKQIFFDCGTNDPFYSSNNELRHYCDSLGINATYISQPGAHNNAYWRHSIRQQMDFFKQQATISD